MQHDFCHIELNTNDAAGAKKFYVGLFDWETEDWPMPQGRTYTIVKPGKGPMGGIMKSPVEHPPMWLVYVMVENVEAAAKKAVKLGGKLIMGKTPVSEMGFFAVLQDPQGAVFMVWEPIKK